VNTSFIFDAKGGDVNLGVKLPLQIGGNGFYGGGGITGYLTGLLVPRPSNVGHQYNPSAPLNNVVEGTDRSVDAVRVADNSTLHYIMIHTNQHHLAGQVCVLNQRELILICFLFHLNVLCPLFVVRCQF